MIKVAVSFFLLSRALEEIHRNFKFFPDLLESDIREKKEEKSYSLKEKESDVGIKYLRISRRSTVNYAIRCCELQDGIILPLRSVVGADFVKYYNVTLIGHWI